MSTLITTILSAVKSNIATVLGGAYSELDYTHDVSKNKWKGSNSRYGVLALESIQTSGVTSYYTVDHKFQVILTNSYKTGDNNDSDLSSKLLTMQELFHDIYVSLYKAKCGAPSVVMNIRDITIDEYELLADDKVIKITATFLITYRNSVL